MLSCSVGGVRDRGCGHAVWEVSGIEGVAPPTLHVIYVSTIKYVCVLFARIHYDAAAVTCMIPIVITGIAIARYTHNLL